MKYLVFLTMTLSYLQAFECSTFNKNKSHKALVNKSVLFENGQNIDIYFKDGSTSLQQFVARESKLWTRYANLNFRFHVGAQVDRDKANIVISFYGKGNYSLLGNTYSRYDRRDHSMSLETVRKLYKTNPDIARGTVLHEFGHAIGFHHEHQSKNNLIRIDENKIEKFCKSQRWSKEKCNSQIVTKIDREGKFISILDVWSIMFYGVDIYDSSFKRPADTHYLSGMDMMAAAMVYPGRKTFIKEIANNGIEKFGKNYVNNVVIVNSFKAVGMSKTVKGVIDVDGSIINTPLYKLSKIDFNFRAANRVIKDPRVKIKVAKIKNKKTVLSFEVNGGKAHQLIIDNSYDKKEVKEEIVSFPLALFRGNLTNNIKIESNNPFALIEIDFETEVYTTDL